MPGLSRDKRSKSNSNHKAKYQLGQKKQKKMGESRFKSKLKGNNKLNSQHNEQQKQNPNSLIEKAKLQSLNSDQQLELLKQLHSKIIISPEDNFKHLETMFLLIKTPNLKVVSTALRVLAETFINIAPLQPIDINKLQQRTSNRITKDQYKVVKFEKNLIQQYDRYIRMLKQMHTKTKPQNFKNDQQIYKEFKKCLLECVIKCYRTLWNFNLAKQLNQLCLRFIKYEECRNFLKQMLMDKNIGVLSAKAKIIAGISKIIKTQQFEKRLPSDIIQIINSTYIDTRYLKKDQDSLNYRKKQLKKKLYKQEAFQQKKQKEKRAERGTLEMKRKKREQKVKQKMRVRQEVNKQFAEGEATIENKELVRYNSQILQQLFYIYFKILVQRINSLFLKDALDGILKFVHLINIELTQSLLQHLDSSAATFRQLWKMKKTSQILEVRLLIIFTGQSIINGPLSVYNMDDIKITTHLYKLFKDLNLDQTKITKQTYRLLCTTLDQTFVKRRQLSQQIIGSFVRQIAIFLKQKQKIPKLYLLQLIRVLAYRYGKISRMFEADNEGFGLNSFNPLCQDPQCSNAINTEIISYLRLCKSKHSKEYQNSVDHIVQKLCKQNFIQKDVKQSLYNILQKQMEDQRFF